MKRFKNILYVVESLATDRCAFDQAVDLAKKNDASLTIIAVHKELAPRISSLIRPRLEKALFDEENAVLDKLRSELDGHIEVKVKTLVGTPFLEIIRDVLRHGRDLIVKTANPGGGPLGGLFGSLDKHLLRKCPCPVWLIAPSKRGRFQRILAAVDYDDFALPGEDVNVALNREILEVALSLAYMGHGELHIVHAWQPSQESLLRRPDLGFSDEDIEAYVKEARLDHRNWFDRLLRQARKWIGPKIFESVKPKTRLTEGRALGIIPELARKLEVDLIVMGTVGRTGVSGLLIGNTAETILGRIDCSVLALKPPGFITPVTLEE